MSYSLYSYLKENPRRNGPKVGYNWAALLNDDTVPQSVKTELRELIKHRIITLTDAILFWSDHVQMLRMTDVGEYRLNRGKQVWCVHDYPLYKEFDSQFALTVYSLAQLEPDNATEYATLVYKTIFSNESRRTLFCQLPNWTVAKVKQVITRMSYRLDDPCAYVYYGNTQLRDEEVSELYTWLDDTLLRVINRDQLREIKQLIKDCDQPTEKFRSLNEIERAHDARTERTVAKMEAENKTLLVYNSELVKVAKQYGFTLPESNLDFVKRGRQHNNCVATYFGKHTAMRMPTREAETHEVSRLFFTDSATLELGIEYCDKGIISTHVIQYKGRFNRDAQRDNALIAFRITLVGMPVEVLVVREVSNDKKH
jgi:hypothetical protein